MTANFRTSPPSLQLLTRLQEAYQRVVLGKQKALNLILILEYAPLTSYDIFHLLFTSLVKVPALDVEGSAANA